MTTVAGGENTVVPIRGMLAEAEETPLAQAFEFALLSRYHKNRRCHRPAKAFLTGSTGWLPWLSARGVRSLDDLTSVHTVRYLSERLDLGDSASTVRSRIAYLRGTFEEAMRSTPPLATRPCPRLKGPRAASGEKWWLTPEQRPKVIAALRYKLNNGLMADYVEFICETGLRVEEALRVQRRHLIDIDSDKPGLMVPGTKTAGARRPIPISVRAAEIAKCRLWDGAEDAPLFPTSYTALRQRWQVYRTVLGLPDDATLKGLRRSFAGSLHSKGAPTEDIRRLMRHAKISTTAEYLQLIGSADLEPTRRWL
jgi:integrase